MGIGIFMAVGALSVVFRYQYILIYMFQCLR